VSQIAINSKAIKKSSKSVTKIIQLLLFYFIVAVLLISGIAKIIDPLPLIKTLEAFKLFSFTPFENVINIFIATTLPILEIGLAILLITKTNIKLTLLITLILFILFLFISIYGYYIGVTNNCACFGDLIKSEFGVGMIVRNLGFVGVILILNKNCLAEQ